MSCKVLNINVGLLGHVDSGKTSLARCLSEIPSTAAFDKHPQSQERGITIDLGFSSFSTPPPEPIQSLGFGRVQFTLVDCPGHASLIRTIIGGIQIIDIVILVIDVTKGIQSQTAECIVLAQVAKKPMVVVLNKVDALEETNKSGILHKTLRRMEKTLNDLGFEKTAIVPVVAKKDYSGERGLKKLVSSLDEIVFVPQRDIEKPLVLAVDHCFLIKGKGTVLTGTVLQGTIRINDDVEMPALKEIRKVKSIQMFRRDVREATQGDRIGVCLKQLDPTRLERGLASKPGYLPIVQAVIILLNKVQFFKSEILSNSKYHISLGYETVIGKMKMFKSKGNDELSVEKDYEYVDKLNDDAHFSVFGLIELERGVCVPPDSVVIGSKLDVSTESRSCRLAFHGRIVRTISEKSNQQPEVRMYAMKEKNGVVLNALSEREVVAQRLCKKHSSIERFINFQVSLSTGENGYIGGVFGQKDKVRVVIPQGLAPATFDAISSLKKQKKARTDQSEQGEDKREPVRVRMIFKSYLFEKEKKVTQGGLF